MRIALVRWVWSFASGDVNDILGDLGKVSLFSGLACSARHALTLTHPESTFNVENLFLWLKLHHYPIPKCFDLAHGLNSAAIYSINTAS